MGIPHASGGDPKWYIIVSMFERYSPRKWG